MNAGERDRGHPSSLEAARAVLLVEFIDVDRFPGQLSKLYPLLLGYLRTSGVPARWVRYGVTTDNLHVHGLDAVTLGNEEYAHLLRVVRELRPDLVVTSHEVRSGQRVALEEAGAGARFVVAEDLLEGERRSSSPLRFRAHAELEREGFAPCYDWDPGNAGAARHDRNNVYVLLRRSCGYRKAVEANPFYSGLALPRETRIFGCAFCGVTADRLSTHEDASTPPDWVTRQIEALAASRGLSAKPNALIFEDFESAALIETALVTLERLSMRDVKVLLALRADRILEMEAVLRSFLPRLEGLGCAIHVHVMGLESFVDEELGRLNKGFTGLQAVKAVNLMRGLQSSFPTSFHFSGYRPFTMILFSPWTTLEDLELNLSLIRHLGVAAEIGNAFVSRLRLHPDLAVTSLARRDGLLTDAPGDEALRLNRRKLFPEELPWRFRDPRLEPINSFATRLEGAGAVGDDERTAMLEASLESCERPGGWDQEARLALLGHAVDAARSTAETLSYGTLLAAAVASWRDQEEGRRFSAVSAGHRLGYQTIDLETYLDRVSCLPGPSKPVLSVERASLASAEALDRDKLEERGLHVSVFPDPEGTTGTVLLSRDPSLLAEARRLESARRDGRDGPGLRVALGGLYGYPECCARAWSTDPWAQGRATAWAFLDRHLEADGPAGVRPLLLPGLLFVPCTSDCRLAGDRFRLWMEALGARGLVEDDARLVSLFAPEDGQLVSVEPTSFEDGWLLYSGRTVRGDGSIAETVRRGSALRSRSSQIQVRDEGGILGAWTARAILWDRHGAAERDLWRELAKARRWRDDPARNTSHFVGLCGTLADPVTSSTARGPSRPRLEVGKPEGPTPDTRASVASSPVVNWSELTLTPRCNQRCFFCYEDARSTAKEPSLEKVKELLRETRKQAEQVVLCGREALLRRDLFEIVRFASDIGLRPVVFTNGQLLARREVVTALAEAGCASLAISFHFPDPPSLARGARVSPRCFDRIVAGMRNVREHNEAHPDRPLSVSTETDMFALNAGRLDEMRRTLRDALGSSPWQMRLATLLPTRTHDIGLGHVLDPLETRREEVEEFVRSQPEDVPLGFVKVPLCLLPLGTEHRSLDVQYVHHGTVLTFNHLDPDTVSEDRISPSGDRDIGPQLQRHPYRWVCRSCDLLALCRFERVDWSISGFLPTREQRPLPYRQPGAAGSVVESIPLPSRTGTASEVLARIGPNADANRRVDLLVARLRERPFPEEEILLGLSKAGPGDPRLVDAYVSESPILAVVLSVDGEPVHLQLGAPTAGASAPLLGSLVGYLAVRPVAERALPHPRTLLACLRRLAQLELPPPQQWRSDPWFDVRAAVHFQACWRAFGERLWPGFGTFGEWTTSGTRLGASQEVILEVAHPAGEGALVLLAPRDLTVAGRSPCPAMPFGVDVQNARASVSPGRVRELLAAVASAAGLPTSHAAPGIPLAALAGCRFRLEERGWVSVGRGASPGSAISPPDRGTAGEGPERSISTNRERRLRFVVGPCEPGSAAWRRVGRLALWPDRLDLDRVDLACAGVLAATMKHLQDHPPQKATLRRWRDVIGRIATPFGLATALDWRVELDPAREDRLAVEVGHRRVD